MWKIACFVKLRSSEFRLHGTIFEGPNAQMIRTFAEFLMDYELGLRGSYQGAGIMEFGGASEISELNSDPTAVRLDAEHCHLNLSVWEYAHSIYRRPIARASSPPIK